MNEIEDLIEFLTEALYVKYLVFDKRKNVC